MEETKQRINLIDEPKKFVANLVVTYCFDIIPLLRDNNFQQLSKIVCDLESQFKSIDINNKGWSEVGYIHADLAIFYLNIYVNRLHRTSNSRILDNIEYDVLMLNKKLKDDETYNRFYKEKVLNLCQRN